MIVARIEKESGAQVLLIVLEPGNIEKMKKGEPIHKFMAEFGVQANLKTELVICYTPDILWVDEQVRSGKMELAEALQASLERAPIIRNKRDDAERLEKLV